MPGISVSKICVPFGGGGINWSSYWTTSNLVIEGHSFVIPANAFGDCVLENIAISGFYNPAVGGETVSDLTARAATTDSHLVVETDGNRNIMVLWIGVNGFYNDVGIGATRYAEVKSYVLNRRTAGWKVFVYTMTPSTAGGRGAVFESERDIFNGLLRSDLATNYNVYILDTDTVSELDDPSDTTYYADTIHLTSEGYYYASTLFAAKIAELGTPTTPSMPVDNAIDLTLTPVGDGSGIGHWDIAVTEPVLITLDNSAEFYRDAAATLRASGTIVLQPTQASTKRIYFKCPSGVSNVKIDKDAVYSLTHTNGTNGSSIGGDIGQLTVLEKFRDIESNTISGSITNLTSLNYLLCVTGNTLSGDVTALTDLTYLYVTGSNTITGSITNLIKLTYLYVGGTNTLSGSLSNLVDLTFLILDGNVHTVSGDLGLMCSKLTDCYIGRNNRIATYTSGAEWLNTRVQIVPGSGYGLSTTLQAALLKDLNDSSVGPTSKTVALAAYNASMADTNQGGIWGDFSGVATPSDLAVAVKGLAITRTCSVTLRDITLPGGTGDGTGFPAGFGDWYRS